MRQTIIKILIMALVSLNIDSTFADYTRNINDDMKIYNIDKKLKNYIYKSKNPDFTQKRLIKKVEKLLSKNESELNKIFDYPRKKEFKSFKEYALIKIHDFLIYGDIFIGVNNDPSYAKVLENDYIKIIVSDTGFTLNNDELFWTRKDGTIFHYIEFYKIKSEEKTENYIKNNFLNKEGKIKCELVEKKAFTNQGESYYFGLLKKYQNKEIYPGSAICPSDFTKGHSNNGINYFQRISPTTLIYINAGQNFVGIDFSSMEEKK